MFPKEWEELHIWQKIDSTFTKVYNKVKKVSWYEWGDKGKHNLLLYNENSELSNILLNTIKFKNDSKLVINV